MTFDEFVNQTQSPQNADEALVFIRNAATITDVPTEEKAAFSTGILMGMSWIISMAADNRIKEAGQTMIQLQGEWEAHDII